MRVELREQARWQVLEPTGGVCCFSAVWNKRWISKVEGYARLRMNFARILTVVLALIALFLHAGDAVTTWEYD